MGEGEVEGIAAVVVLHLECEDGRILVQLAERDGQGVQERCLVPGKKLEVDMGPNQALVRLLQGAFAPFKSFICFVDAEQEVTWEESTRMQFRTKYLRTVKYAELTCPVGALQMDDVHIPLVPSEEAPTSNALDLFALADGTGKLIFVSWLTDEDLRYYSSLDGKEHLQDMLNRMAVEPAVVDAAEARFAALPAPF